MCAVIVHKPSGIVFETIADLRAAGMEVVILTDPEYPPDLPDNCCLCPVDIMAVFPTAVFDGVEYVVEKQ